VNLRFSGREGEGRKEGVFPAQGGGKKKKKKKGKDHRFRRNWMLNCYVAYQHREDSIAVKKKEKGG